MGLSSHGESKEASNDWDRKSNFLELLNYSAVQSLYKNTRNTQSIKYIKTLKLKTLIKISFSEMFYINALNS